MAPSIATPEHSSNSCQPKDELMVEEDFKRICAEVLRRPIGKVKMGKSFLAQGGDSLLAIKLMARCGDEGYGIDIQDIIQAISIRQLCQSAKHLATNAQYLPADKFASGNASSESLEQHLGDQVVDQLRHICPDPVQDVQELFPCSPTQESFLIAQAVYPQMYQCTFVVRIKTAALDTLLDETRLQAAWAQLVERHAALRTVFIDSVERPGHFDQVVFRKGLVPLEYVEEQESSFGNLSSRRPITFEKYDATHRVFIEKESPSTATLRVDMSHAVTDGQSGQVLLRDLCRAYNAESSSDIIMSYREFVISQQEIPREESIKYWSRYLADAQPSFFPINGDHLYQKGLEVVRKEVRLNPGVLEQFCGKFNVTAANLCQVAWALVLRSYTGSEDVCFSYVTSGRQGMLKGINNTVGAFVNTVICRIKIPRKMTIEQALAQSRTDYLECLKHPYMEHGAQSGDFARLKGNTLMSCQRRPFEDVEGSGLAFELLDVVNPTEYDLSLNIETHENGFEVAIDFWNSRIERGTVESVASTFQQAFLSLLDEDSQYLEQVEVVTPEEIEQIREWNKNIPQGVQTRMQDPVYKQRLLRPDAWAIQSWDGDMTYKQLDMAANALASYLVTLGVQPETKIPICFEKSRWAVVSQLAILKAGGCVVPLGSKQPMRRIEMILQDIEARIILTADTFVEKFQKLLRYVVTVDENFVLGLPHSEAPSCSATFKNAAFIIYTSGSTGVPKGVVLTHGSLCTSVHHLGAKFKLSSETRMIQFSAYTFDISIQDIYATWNYGGCLCIIPEGERINNLGPAMRAYQVNAAGLTSTVAGLISPEEVPSLQTLVLLGEAVKPAVVDQWIGHVTLFNAYGPSECSIQGSCTEIGPGCDPLNIGFAFAGALWVVEPKDYNRLAPIGAPGELLIEGPLQARGYLNDEVKTAAAFVTDPSWASKYGFGPGRRFYRTGDLVQQNQDGSITYIGRRDTQIKVRGQRVETGEIEYNLMQNDAVIDAAVLYPLHGPCENRLVGLLSLREFVEDQALGLEIKPVSHENLTRAKLELSAISQYLTAYVPEHMLPSIWIPLACMMPQNDSAKLDRKRLTQWVESMEQSVLDAFTSPTNSQEPGRAPATRLEREIQSTWSDVLKLPLGQVPVEQHSFLGLGGDSLAAMQVASRLRTQGIFVMVRTVLESKSIALLAMEADETSSSTEDRKARHSQQLYLESPGMPPISLDYWGLELEKNIHADQISQETVLDEYHTGLLLGEANNARRTVPADILMAALFHSFRQTFPDRLLPVIFDETHSRDVGFGPDASIGAEWHTAMIPVYISSDAKESTMDILPRIKESRQRVRIGEAPSFVATLLTPEKRETFTSTQGMEILFKYPARFVKLEKLYGQRIPHEVAASPIPDDTRRLSAFVIEVLVLGNRLHVDFQYNRQMKYQDGILHWVKTYNKCLCDLISELAVTQPTLTLSDFPLIAVSSAGLVKLQDTILPKEQIRLEQIEDIYPCSPTQQGILMSQLKSPSEYYIQQSIEITPARSSNAVSIDRFMGSWQSLVNRHPVLRTVFVESAAESREGLLDQLVLRSCKANMEHKTCSETDIEAHLAVKTNLSKDMFKNQLGHKLTVYSTPSSRIYAQIIISHALVDASSLVLLQKELAQIYDRKILTDSSGPAFSSFISYLQQTPEDEALQYWTSRLTNAEPCYMPSFTNTWPSPQRQSTENVALQHITADLDVTGLQEFSKTHGVTVANIFQLSWALVLSQYTGSSDISFGYISSGRDVPVVGVQKMLGPLLNMMVTRIKLDPALRVGDAVKQIQDDFFNGFGYQRAPLSKIWHALELKGQSLFNTSISYQHALVQKEDESDIFLEPITGEDRTEYDVTVNVFVSENKTSVSLQYSPDFLSSEGASRLVQCLQQVLRSLATNPNLPVGQVQMITQEDAQQICAWNHETLKTRNDHCIHDLVTHQRRLDHQAQAVCAWDGDLTYEELDDLSDQLAHHLATDLHVGPEVKVPLCFDKSLWSIVAQLGVLKAGGVVVSVNPKHPLDRLEGILQDIDANVMLTTSQYSGRFNGIIDHVLDITSDLFSHFPKREGPACRTVTPDNSAFIIYTSGSTGQPKGVILTHLALTASFQGHGKAYGMNPDTRSVQFASYTFDASISDIWGTIYHGGCVCVISEEQRMNDLQRTIESYHVNLAQLTPTVAELLDVSKLTSLKTLILGGEPVKAGIVEKLLSGAGKLDILNGYGPSECSIYATCSAPLKNQYQAPNVGRPLVGGVWLISNDNCVCPIGSVGEVWIEGPLLARGYLNDQQKTDRYFVTNPSWARTVGLEGHRFYRTGDLARQTPTGDLIHLGRKDNQVKIRGQRVEIGEIEYAVKKFFPAAKSVVATILKPNSSDRSPMVAAVIEMDYISQTDVVEEEERVLLPSDPSIRDIFSQLRSSLADALPLYMVPRLFVPALKLPQTTSGKLDRRLVQQLLEKISEEKLFQYSLSTVENARPSTETQRELQLLWAAVLGMDANQVGIHEHFLHFGGDSVTAMRLVSMANSSGISLTVSDIFTYPKLQDMAAHVDKKLELDYQSLEVPRFALWKERKRSEDSDYVMTERLREVAGQCDVSIDNIEDIYPCTPLQEGLMAITAQKPHAYMGRWVFRIHDSTDSQQYMRSWETLSNLVPILRTRIIPGELSRALQVVVRQPITCLEANNLDDYLKEDTRKSFPYGSPLVRAAVIETPEKERYFVLTAHHSTYDGWSLVRLFGAVSHIYSEQKIPSPPSFTRFIQYLDQQDPVATKAFWESHLEGGIVSPFPTLSSPSYQPRPSQVKICRLETGQMEGSATLASLLRAAWAMVVSSYTHGDVLLAVALSGRAAPVSGVQDMIAPTITTVPVRISVDTSQTINDYVASVHQQAIDMIPFEHTGLQNIRRLVNNAVYPQHLFVVQPAEERENLVNGKLLTLEPGTNSAQVLDGYALTVECFTGIAGQKTVDIEARFDDNVLSCAQTTRLLDRFRHIFDQLLRAHALTTEGQKLVRDIETVSPGEITQLAEWNRDIPGEQQVLVHDLVHQQAIVQPDADAICSWDGNLSRYELDCLAEKLAHHLVHLGVGPEVMVALCFDKSKWAVVSMLAILKAGGSVVPVRAQPVQRLQAIIDSTKLNVALTTRRPESRFPCQVPHVLAVDDDFMSGAPEYSRPVDRTVCPQNAAFVFHTSGSTGVPKGVVIEHGTMSTSLQSHGAKFGMTPETRAFQFSHLTFDISLHDIITTLQFGGCVCLPSEQERVNNLAGAINRMEVNYTFLPPRVLHTVMPSDIPKVRTIIVGGEAVQADQIEPWIHEARIFNAYGPAECSIASTCNEVLDKNQASNIGRAIAGGLWVVDEADHNRLLPIGAVGELLIEGPLLARGYLNDPQKTSAAFVSNPAWLTKYRTLVGGKLGSKAERRMYRTGDLVQQTDDGALIYVGRRDNQVQVRGQRVEIGEIEHYLVKHPAVADGVVLYPRCGPSKSRLVGVVALRDFISKASHEFGPTSEVLVTATNQLPQALEQISSIRQNLLSCVPEYMVPDAWISLVSMPQNNSDKIDRPKITRWLEDMDAEHLDSITRAPKDDAAETQISDLEQHIRTAYADVLQLPLTKVPLNRSFLSIGGDSITAMQVVSVCVTRYGISLAVQDILQCQSITELSQKANVRVANVEETDTIDSPFNLTPAQKMYFESIAPQGLEIGGEYRFNQSVSIKVNSTIGVQRISLAADALVKKHPMLRTRFLETEFGYKQRVEPDVPSSFPFHVHDAPNLEQAKELASSFGENFNLQTGPVFSVDWVQVASNSQQLLFLTAHHLAVDNSSWNIIMRDLEELVRHPTSSVMSNSTSIQKCMQLQARQNQENISLAQSLATGTPIVDLSYWGITSEDNTYADCMEEGFTLEEEYTSMLFDKNQPLRTEPVEIMIAALFHSHCLVFPDRSIPTVFNAEHNRKLWAHSIDLSNTVGWLTSLTPLHIQVDRNNPIDIVRRTKDARRSIRHDGLEYFPSSFVTLDRRDPFAPSGYPEVTFGYTEFHERPKSADSMFTLEHEFHVADIGKNVRRGATFEIQAFKSNNSLRIGFCFNKRMRHQDAVQRWVRTYHSSLKEMLDILAKSYPTCTLSDLSAASMTYEELISLDTELLPRTGIDGLSEVHDIYSCSSVQQGILMSQIKDPNIYYIQETCEVTSLGETPTVDLGRLSAAWKTVVARHAILRTVFIQSVSGHDLFYQVVRTHWEPQIRRVRCSSPNDVLTTFAQAGRPQYADGEPQHQLSLCETAAGQTYIQVDVSHALIDASSFGIIIRDLVQAYDQVLSDLPAPSYGSYISFLQQSSADESLAYWTNHLARAQPSYFPSSPAPTSNMREFKNVVAEFNDMELLHEFRDTHGVTIANILQLAWAIVMSRYTQSPDVTFGYLANGRDAPISGINEMAGPMINLLITRIQLGEKGMTVADAAKQVQQTFFESFKHQRTSLGDIQHALRLSEQSLFNTTVSYKRQPVESLDGPVGLAIKSISGEGPTEYDLNLDIAGGEKKMRLLLQYASSFMDDNSASHIMDCLQSTLFSIISNDQAPLSEVEVLAPSHIDRLKKWNSDLPGTKQTPVQAQIYQQQLSQPPAPAVCAWDGQLTYEKLGHLSDRLAQHLIGLGVCQEVMVGLCFEKSMWTIVAMLAVLKAGGVVVPLGVQLPLNRLRFILEDTAAPVVLTSEIHAIKFKNMPGVHVLPINESTVSEFSEVGSPLPPVVTKSENSAVVIYTSGSTGQPKGVILTHGSLSTSVEGHGTRLGLGPSTRTLQFSAYVFDISLLDVFSTLHVGGCVCVVSEEDRMDIGNLARSMEIMGVNFAVLTPTVASLLEPQAVPTLCTLVLAGEKVQPVNVETWSPHATVFNGYGPAECSILATINGPLTDKAQAANVGTAVAGALWVVDQDDYNSLVPPGAVGELLIEGPLVAREYLHDEDKTREAFVTKPSFISRYQFGEGRGRMYKTGDLVRQDPTHGSVTYIGRADGQIKIRGQRVEVGEIEYWAKQNLADARMAAATLVQSPEDRNHTLLAVAIELQTQGCASFKASGTSFIPITDSLRNSLLELQESLARALPSYMVPSLYIPIWNIPVTPSGKLDRKSLGSMLEYLSEEQLVTYALVETADVEPSTETQCKLRDLWASILPTTGSIGANSHFFRFGGDSVSAMRLVALARNVESPISLNVADVFTNPVLSDMADVIENRLAENPSGTETDITPFSLAGNFIGSGPNCLVPISLKCNVATEAIEDIYPCTPLQEGLMAITAQQPLAYINRWIFRIDQSVDVYSFKNAWEKVFDLAPILRTRILQGPTPGAMQVVIREKMCWAEVDSDLEPYRVQDTAKPMGFGTPLMRFAIISGPSGRYFVWTAHHSVYDGWASSKILETVLKIYLRQSTPNFAPYTRFIQFLQNTSSSDTEKYWHSQLTGGMGPSFPVPPKHYQPGPPQKLTHRINTRPIAGGITIATLLRSTWAMILSRETESHNVVFPTTLSGRSAPVADILDIVAPTITTVPIRIFLNRSQKLFEFLLMVQQQSIDMIPFEHTGLQNIRSITKHSSFDFHNLFVVQPSADGPDGAFPGLQLLPAEEEEHTGYPLVVVCNTALEDQNNIIDLDVRFDQELLPKEKMQSLLEQFEHVFLQLQTSSSSENEGSDTLVGDVNFMTTRDVDQIREWNQCGQVSERANACVHDLVHKQLLARPEAPAVCAWDGDLSYKELEQLASRLAHHLSTNFGVGPEIAVPAIFEKTKWAIVSQLAILKAGGVIVPINHQHPTQRVQSVVKSVGAKVILTSQTPEHFDGHLPNVLVVNEELLAQLPLQEASTHTTDPTDPAYIIFTSGSTGIPKGVVLEHGSIVTSMQAQGAQLAGPETRTLQFSAFNFDVSIGEVFTTLISGGCVCVISEDDRMNDLASAMKAAAVNLAFLTPTVASLMRPSEVPALEKLVFLGEALRPEVAAPWFNSEVQLFNAYGPAESSILTTINHITDSSQAPNIGTSLGGGKLWVTDSTNYHQLVPVGNVGELLIEGPLLARGYLRDEEKTAKSFVTDPDWSRRTDFGSNSRRRFYRTGDLVRQNRDGSLVYIGRRDTQVKINGQRVEIGEIEFWVKEKFPGVQEVAVGLVELKDVDGVVDSQDTALAVAMELQDSAASDTQHQEIGSLKILQVSSALRQNFAELRASLLEVLPPYMVPQLFLPVVSLPLTDSGKLDRRVTWDAVQKLPSLSQYFLINEVKVAPSTPAELHLQELWATALNVPASSIGAKDDFFRSGGDSISAMRLVSKGREHGQLSLNVSDIFRHPLLSELAAVAEQRSENIIQPLTKYEPFSAINVPGTMHAIKDTLSPLLSTPGVIVDAAPVTDFQAHSVITSLRESRDLLAYVSIDGDGIPDIARWKASCLELIKRHEALRTAYIFHEEQLLQVVLEEYRPEIVHYETEKTTIDQLTRQLIAQDMYRQPQLGQPFVQFAIVTSVSDLQHRIIFRLSHAEYDGISMSYFMKTLQAIYDQQPVESYTPFSQYVYGLSARNKEESRQYWRSLLQNASMPTIANEPDLPRQRPAKLNHHSTRKVNANQALPIGITMSTIIRAGWALVLGRHVNKQDVVFGEVVSGRNTGDPVAEKAAGCCVNAVPTRATFDDSWTVSEFLGHLQRQQLDRLPHETLGLREIFRSCTNMPASTHFTSQVNHRHETPGWKLNIGEVDYNISISLPDSAEDFADIDITSFMQSDYVEIALGHLDGVISPQLAGSLMNQLCMVVNCFLNGSRDSLLGSVPS